MSSVFVTERQLKKERKNGYSNVASNLFNYLSFTLFFSAFDLPVPHFLNVYHPSLNYCELFGQCGSSIIFFHHDKIKYIIPPGSAICH